MTTIEIKPTAALTPAELVELFEARVRVFVVEQHCAYQEVDEKDLTAWHVILRRSGRLVAAARIVPHDDGEHISFGRVLVTRDARGQHLATGLITETLLAIAAHFPGQSIKIQAQVYLRDWYGSFGFVPVSEPYLEDGIPHVDMVLTR
ncbi:GNAT family N-acetyltransferase [Lacticaseibacillus absianus]|uniref:GNAT family N-acetyltransferase n=1 Tax=Lacticaseibacillus absianus TaxID=2729623 RepID=UPI0015CDD405|nr:GNAT family N-acetyltransferase [Lacticaseibacillus absianus]